MIDPVKALGETLDDVGRSWRRTPAGERFAVDDLTGSELVELNDRLGRMRRQVDAAQARVASAIARQSRPEHGSDGLAKKNGYRSPAVLIATTTGTTVGEAAKLVAVGDATAPRRTFSGDDAPARHPHVAAALEAGRIGMAAASAIIAMLDRVALRANRSTLDTVEATLAASAPGLSIDQLAKVIARAEAYLDPDGLEPKEHELRSQRSLVMFERGGMLHLNAKFGPVEGAAVKTAIQAIVTAEFRNESDAGPAGRTGASAGSDGGSNSGEASHGNGTLDSLCAAEPTDDGAAGCDDVDAPRRTVAQRQADAFAMLCAHFSGCDSADMPVTGATVIVRMSLADLESGTGIATIDGLDQPVSAATARRMAATGSVIPCVLGEHSEILDWGREKRLFTRAQKLALVERDGGCAMCGLPPGMTKVHHLRWWARDTGPTDLANGILLCESCHHRIHDNGWNIRIDGPGTNAPVWFIPPAHVDPRRTPRPGGHRRFTYAA